MPKGSLIDFGPTAGLYYSNGKFYDADGNRVDPSNRPAPAPAAPTAAAAAPPPEPKPFTLPSFDASMFPAVDTAPQPPRTQSPLPDFQAAAPQMQPPPRFEPIVPPAPQPVPAAQPQAFMPTFTPPPAAMPSFEAAPPPSTTFLEQARINLAPPPTPASVTPALMPPAPPPIRPGPTIKAQDYAPAPEMPGYAQARTGAPFRAPQAADLGNLFGQMGKTTQPFGAPEPVKDGDYYADLYRSIAGRIF